MPERVELHTETPPPEQHIESLFVWVAIHENGGEGIMSADLSLDFGTRHTPLMSSKLLLAELLRVVARLTQDEMAAAGTPIQIELREFRRVP